jgi:uroporphyrinogen decarboxylase
VVSLDWRTEVKDARRRLGFRQALQGNLDPAVLYAPPEIIRQRAREILQEVGPTTPHIFNLGHGVTPETPIDGVSELVRFVHEEGRRLRDPGANPVATGSQESHDE